MHCVLIVSHHIDRQAKFASAAHRDLQSSFFRRMTNTRGDLELERQSPLWGPGTRIILLTPLYYLDLYTTNICLRCLSLALVHAGKAELGLLTFILMDSRRTPTLPLKPSGGQVLSCGAYAAEEVRLW